MQRECLYCGMPATLPALQIEDLPPGCQCLKCDGNLYGQTDGSCLNVDVAHQGETLSQAMEKLDRALLAAWDGYSRELRLITGSGAIRREVLGQLEYYRQQHYLRAYAEDSPNRGAILVRIRE